MYTPFPILNQFVVPCPVLTVASCHVERFLRGQVRWSGIPILLRIFHLSFGGVGWGGSTAKGFSIVNEAKVDVLLDISSFFSNSMNVGNLISGFYNFSKSSLYMWKFSVHILLKPHLENFKHYFASM